MQYDISKSGLSSRSLLLTVWDWSRFGRSQFLGEVCLPLSSLELTDSCSQPDQWYLLQDKVCARLGFKSCTLFHISQ